ncbi:type I restriction-modification system subunit M [Bifidobacterium dentium]|uniref:type I restriction-modification system subunit M n=1 Tax=Bifidobacterium dentium TaxID=1689 RepID=UPI0018B0B5AB|nr:type I restriction-modification system subunit M [Bifidobacterium dentium]MBF9669071.1 type I restriction-modification system subunit M [Bifidobacterium dentium]
MNKQQLASKIWESANKMRSKIEANEYKDYILGFIFYKFLSETELTRLRANDFTEADMSNLTEDNPDIVEFVQGECGYFIAYENLFSTWVRKGNDFEISDVRDALSAFSRNISPAHKKVFDGVFDTLQTGLSKLGTDARSQSKAARDLIYLINDIPMDSRQDYDVLGFIYEYLISNFAANAGKKAGEFYTPSEVSQLMSEIVAWHLQGREQIKIYDPTSGSGSLLIHIGQAVARRNGNPDSIKYYAQELKENTYNLTRMNLVMRGILPDNIVARNGDTLEDDWPWFDTEENKEETYDPLFVDAVVSNPPYSQNWDSTDKELDPRFSYGIAPKSKADYAFLLHDLYHLRPDGIMTIVLPHGVLFRGGEEGQIRKNLIENHHVQAIIGLPANIFFGTGIPTIVMVLRKNRQDGDVLIVDASKHFIKDSKNNKLRASDIKRIVDAVSNNRTVDKFSRLVSIEEIRANDYNLNIPRYVDSSESAQTWDVYASMFGGIPKNEVDEFHEYWRAWPGVKAELFRDDGACYACDHSDVASVVRNNADVRSFIETYERSISQLPSILRSRLIENLGGVDPLAEEISIGKMLDEMLAGNALVDPYDAYQALDDIWNGVSIDLEVLKSEGFDAVRAVDANMVVKKKGGKDVEVQDGWTGRVLPFDLVQRELLHDDLSVIEADENRVQEIQSEIESMMEGFDEEDKQGSDAISQEGDSFVAAELKKTVKAIGKTPTSDFERSLVRAQKLFDESKKLKAAIKSGRAALEEKTCDTIKTLNDEDVKRLMEAKWIKPLQQQLEELPNAVVDEFVGKMTALKDKYATTYADVCDQIDKAEKELASMLDELTGSERDMAGLAKLKALLGGRVR